MHERPDHEPAPQTRCGPEGPTGGPVLHYGGQAVIEGVMMRGPTRVATAVRLPSGRITVRKTPFVSASRKHKALSAPVLRGGLTLIESLALGIKALNYSAGAAMGEAEEEAPAEEGGRRSEKGPGEEAEERPEEAPGASGLRGEGLPDGAAAAEPRGSGVEAGSGTDRARDRGARSDWKTNIALTGTMIAAFGLGILIFFYVPLVLTGLLRVENRFLFNLVDGVIRVIFFLAYIWGISKWREMRRIFEYHGAEHKAIFMQEAGDELTPENARKYATRHPRCGTSFLLIVMVVSILVFMLTGRPQSVLHRLLRLLLIPVIAGISYELMKLSAKSIDSRWSRIVSAPGLWLQRITTKEPSDRQVEVAIAALSAVRIETTDAGEAEIAQ